MEFLSRLNEFAEDAHRDLKFQADQIDTCLEMYEKYGNKFYKDQAKKWAESLYLGLERFDELEETQNLWEDYYGYL